MCREIFVKENALSLFRSQEEQYRDHIAFKGLFANTIEGTEVCLNSLYANKKEYDKSLEADDYNKTKYVVFRSSNEPFIAFSGVIYPEYDFIGNSLQNLADSEQNYDLLTFCSAPMDDDLAVIFSWQDSSSNSCTKLMRSLATAVHSGHDMGDMIFRFVISNCENMVFSPSWWESLPEEKTNKIIERVTDMACPHTKVQAYYLTDGLSDISKWSFENVYSNM